jgi:hypothetical protein
MLNPEIRETVVLTMLMKNFNKRIKCIIWWPNIPLVNSFCKSGKNLVHECKQIFTENQGQLALYTLRGYNLTHFNQHRNNRIHLKPNSKWSVACGLLLFTNTYMNSWTIPLNHLLRRREHAAELWTIHRDIAIYWITGPFFSSLIED